MGFGILDRIKEEANRIAPVVRPITNLVPDEIKSPISSTREALKPVTGPVSDAVEKARETLNPRSLIEEASDRFEATQARLRDYGSTARDRIEREIAEAKETLRPVASGARDLFDRFTPSPSEVRDAVNDARERAADVRETVGDAIDRAIDRVTISREEWHNFRFNPNENVGDVGGTFDQRRSTDPSDAPAAFTADTGQDVIVNAYTHMDDSQNIRADEFGLVKVDQDTYILMLNGVADLGPNFSPGLDHRNNSPRNFTQGSLPSFLGGAGIDNNIYAQMVREAVEREGPDGNRLIPVGADVLIVGHSDGFGTAVDLASDPDFNNPETGINITHVAISGYAGEDTLQHVQPHTNVLAVNNRDDLIREAEDAATPLTPDDTPDSWERTMDAVGTVFPLADRVRTDTIGGRAAEYLFRGGVTRIYDEINPPAPEIHNGQSNLILSEFRGGFREDAGHGYGLYGDHFAGLPGEEGTLTGDFFAGLEPYTGGGETSAVDISVPEAE